MKIYKSDTRKYRIVQVTNLYKEVSYVIESKRKTIFGTWRYEVSFEIMTHAEDKIKLSILEDNHRNRLDTTKRKIL